MLTTSETLLANPYWSALVTSQAHIAIGGPRARRFPAQIIPFGGMDAHTPEALAALADLLAPEESIYVVDPLAVSHPQLAETRTLPGMQMLFPEEAPLPPADPRITVEVLQEADVPAMIELKAVAFPGYFGPRAAGLGAFVGIRDAHTGELVAMCGERLMLPGFRELSALCTHPMHLGRGYAAALLTYLLHRHRAQGLRSFLHVVEDNTRAIGLYQRLGFTTTRPLTWRRLQRSR